MSPERAPNPWGLVIRRACIAGVLGILFASTATAQQTSTASEHAAPGSAMPLPGTGPSDEHLGRLSLSTLLGATIVSKDHEVVGAINDLVLVDGRFNTAIIGLGGFLGLGEKDVAVPFDTLSFSPPFAAAVTITYPNGHYAGSSPERVLVPMTIEQLSAAPAFGKAEGTSVGVPAQSGGTPEGTRKEPKSSTQAGGPG